jgi:hypothetical protein
MKYICGATIWHIMSFSCLALSSVEVLYIFIQTNPEIEMKGLSSGISFLHAKIFQG